MSRLILQAPILNFYFPRVPRLRQNGRSPDIKAIGDVGKRSDENALESRFSQSDECQPSRDIEEIISILGYLWKIPAPYSGADNGCHTLLSDVDGGRIRFTQATRTHTHTQSLYIVLLV